jgi:hypothetical protein
MKYILIVMLSLCFFTAESQDYIVKDIKSFGAKGDGKANDQDAFQKASDYFNKRGGNGKLIISKGTYIVGKQTFTGGQKNKPTYSGEDVMQFTNIKNFSISGEKGSFLKYMSGLRFGAFTPASGKIYEHGNNYFLNFLYAATIGSCILIQNSSNISISGVTMDGNSNQIILGGVYGDVGRQLPHYGIFISNSKNIQIDNAYIHHFGLDGICVSNKASNSPDSIRITNSIFEYNARQGFSWIGGNQVYVKSCKFNHIGKAKISSAPGAGVDIEAEVSPISNGVFEDCDFIDNMGCGLVALAGDSKNCTFTNCTFFGSTNRAIWISKPNYTFNNCNIYGSFLQGFNADNSADATKFFSCNFVDTVYNGVPTYGSWLIESKNVKSMSFTNCNFVSKVKKLCNFSSPDSYSASEKYQFINCTFKIENNNLPANDFAAVILGASLKNCTFNFIDPVAANKKYYIRGFNEKSNNDLGGNKVIFK